MYSEADLDAAVTAGALPADAVAALRDHVAASRASPASDEEQFRLVTGFNDIFVTIAALLFLIPLYSLTGRGSGFVLAAVSWGLAEYFTRRRRMALPSIVLLLSFAAGMFLGVRAMFIDPDAFPPEQLGALPTALAAAVTAAAAWAHWRRFGVPITIAATTAAVVALLVSLLAAAVPFFERNAAPALLAAGFTVFGYAMWWDMSDPIRRTRRSDVAFWLHLLAAPLIAHSLFSQLGVFTGNLTGSKAILVIALYLLFGVVALLVDRRALLVSGLGYVVYAVTSQLGDFGTPRGGGEFLLTAALIGGVLLLVSAFWQQARRALVSMIPHRLRDRLPPAAQAFTARPAS